MVVLTGTPEVVVVGKPEVQRAVTEISEAVDAGIPDGSTILSGRCLGGQPHAYAVAVITRGNWKRW